jgi:IPT/TIG domain-containing protein
MTNRSCAGMVLLRLAQNPAATAGPLQRTLPLSESPIRAEAAMTNRRLGNNVHSFHRTLIVGLLAVLGMSSGCDNATGPSAPTSPNPPAVAPLNPLSVSAVSPSKGSTGGGTAVTIPGSGFQTGAFVTLGAIRQAANVENSATIRVTTPVHDAGPVEIVVTNPDGQAATFAGGYTYASPQSFDFNGAWERLCPRAPRRTGSVSASAFGHGNAVHDREQQADEPRLRRRNPRVPVIAISERWGLFSYWQR